MRGQELAEGPTAPQEQAPSVLRDRSAEAASSDGPHRDVRYLVDELQRVLLGASAIA